MIAAWETAKRAIFGGPKKPSDEQIDAWRAQEAAGREMQALVKSRAWGLIAEVVKLKLAALSDIDAVQDVEDLRVRKARVQELRGVLELPQRMIADGERAEERLRAAFTEGDGHGG